MYDGITCAQTSHATHTTTKAIISGIDGSAVDYGFGVHIVVPISNIFEEQFDVDSLDSPLAESIKSKLISEARSHVIGDDGDVKYLGDKN